MKSIKNYWYWNRKWMYSNISEISSPWSSGLCPWCLSWSIACFKAKCGFKCNKNTFYSGWYIKSNKQRVKRGEIRDHSKQSTICYRVRETTHVAKCTWLWTTSRIICSERWSAHILQGSCWIRFKTFRQKCVFISWDQWEPGKGNGSIIKTNGVYKYWIETGSEWKR